MSCGYFQTLDTDKATDLQLTEMKQQHLQFNIYFKIISNSRLALSWILIWGQGARGTTDLKKTTTKKTPKAFTINVLHDCLKMAHFDVTK